MTMTPENFKRLKQLATLGDGEIPDWLPTGAWAGPLREVIKEAVAEIEHLRRVAGAVSQGESFADLKRARTEDFRKSLYKGD